MNTLIESYVSPINANDVAGTNIEYDTDFQNLLILVQDKPEQQFGDLIIEASQIDWDKVYSISSDLLINKSKDLLVMSYLTQSSTVIYGLVGFAQGLTIIAQNLEKYWVDIYPRLEDEEGEFDPDFRVNALSLFFSYDGIIKDLRNAFLIKNGLTQASYTIKDIEGILDNRTDSADKYPGGIDRLSIDLQIALDNQAPELMAVKTAIVQLNTIKQLFEEQLPDVSLKFDHIEQLLAKIDRAIGQSVATVETAPVTTNQANGTPVTPQPVQAMSLSSFQINSRQDVELLLEKIYVYFEKHEPSHPAPLFIRRIQRLMNLNFYEIMRDINPESLDRLDVLVGQPLDSQSDDYENND